MDLLKQFIQEAEEKGFYILNAQIRKDGEVADDWARFAARPRFETYSISKTFAGLGVGIALEEGLIALDERISDTFKEESYDVTNEMR